METQSQDAIGEFQRLLSTPETLSKRIAFVVTKSLSRLQIQRAARTARQTTSPPFPKAESWPFADERGTD